jgi:chaperonin GroES
LFVQPGAQVVYSKYAGTEVDFNGEKHLILKDDDIVGILETDDIKDLKPLNDRVLIQVLNVLQFCLFRCGSKLENGSSSLF